jgi:hypothetical protein
VAALIKRRHFAYQEMVSNRAMPVVARQRFLTLLEDAVFTLTQYELL